MVSQYQIVLVKLDPTIGYEIQKIRPALVISPDEMNRNLKTLIIAHMTTKLHDFPTRVSIHVQSQQGYIALDQIRTIDKGRIVKNFGEANSLTIYKVKQVLEQMLIA